MSDGIHLSVKDLDGYSYSGLITLNDASAIIDARDEQKLLLGSGDEVVRKGDQLVFTNVTEARGRTNFYFSRDAVVRELLQFIEDEKGKA